MTIKNVETTKGDENIFTGFNTQTLQNAEKNDKCNIY